MSWGFRKRVKLLPGVSLNLGKRGVSVSAGVRGARVTVAKDRVSTSVGESLLALLSKIRRNV